MIVTIDGPAGAGKSSVAKALARRLGFRFLDTGAMYRAVVWAALDRGVPVEDPARLETLAEEIDLDVSEHGVRVDGRDVTREIRAPRVSEAIHFVADNPRIRGRLVERQRQLAEGDDIVTEGRDQGTVAFPDAACKIFLTASREERARRRFRQLQAEQPHAEEPEVSYEQVLAQQDDRDRRDRERPVGALREAPDAAVVNTDAMTPEEVVDHLEQIVRRKARQHSRFP